MVGHIPYLWRGTGSNHISLLENWGREFEKFAPSINVRTYYGSANDRSFLRQELQTEQDQWDVCITTYNLAQGNEHDRKFFSRRIRWEVRFSHTFHVAWSCP